MSSIQVNITCNLAQPGDVAKVQAALNVLSGQTPFNVVVDNGTSAAKAAEPAKTAEKPAAGKPGKATTAKQTEAAAPTPSTAEVKQADVPPEKPENSAAAETPPDDDDTKITYEDVRGLILKLSAGDGRQQALAVLAEFGVKNGKDLKAEDWPSAYSKLSQALEG